MKKILENEFIFGTVVFLTTVIIYLVTVAPGVTFTDAGELAAVCTTMGIAHPTGYPLYTILGHLWTYLPLGDSSVYSLNLFSVFLVSIANFSLFYLLKNILVFSFRSSKDFDRIIANISALVIGLTFAFSSVIWDQATAIEVYSLHILMLSLILNSSFKAMQNTNSANRYWFFTALLIGLSFSNHMTTILVVPAVIFLYFSNSKPYFSKSKFQFFLLLIFPMLVGLSLYLYLPIISSTDPLFNWGNVSRDFDKFLYHVQGKQYQVWMFSDSEAWGDNFNKFINSLPNQTAIIGFIFLFVGLYITLKKSKQVFWFILILIMFCLSYAFNYSIHDIESYFIASYFGLAFLMVHGLYIIGKSYHKLAYLSLLIPIFHVALTITSNDRSNENYVEEYTKIMVDNLDSNSIIISSEWDYFCSAFWYFQAVENMRPDIKMFELELTRRTWYPDMIKKWHPFIFSQCKTPIKSFLDNLENFESGKPYNANELQSAFVSLYRCIIESNIDERPVYVTHDIMNNEPQIVAGYIPVPEGLAVRLYRQNPEFKFIEFNIDGVLNSVDERKNHLTEGILNTLESKLGILDRYTRENNMPEFSNFYQNQITKIKNKRKEFQ